jgi:uroporphyrinogen decarboxylase
MTSRQRVVRALNRQRVDRTPIDLGGHMSTGISMFAYRNLRAHLGLDTGSIQVPDLPQGLARVDADVLERFHCDCILLEPPFSQTRRWSPRAPYTFTIPAAAQPRHDEAGGWTVSRGGRSMRLAPGGYFFDGDRLSDWGEGSREERIALYAREAERLYKETGYALIFQGYSHGLRLSPLGGGAVELAIMAHDDPDSLRALLAQRLAGNLELMGRIIDAFGPYIQMVSIADDMGGQQGPLCSPAYIEAFCLPAYRSFCGFVHAHSDIKVFLHTCGGVRPLIPLFIEAGIDVLNPVQISAAGMDPGELAQGFGGKICFWGGGCDTQGVLERGSPEDVAANVRELMAVWGRAPGYVFSQVHNVMGNVPPENVVAMLNAAYAAAVPGP